MSAETVERPTPALSSGPILCASWCVDGTGHAWERYAADQWCRSAESRVDTSLYPAWERVDGSTTPAYAVVHSARDAGRPGHVVVLNQNDQAMNLTPEEARDMAKQLVHFAWVAEQDQQQRNAFELGADAARAGLV